MPSFDLYRLRTPTRYLARVVGLFALGMASSVSAHAQCAAATTTRDFEAILGEAEAALSSLDVDTFKALVEGAETMLPCIGDPVAPRLAANFHRVYGIRAFSDRDPMAARAFSAARHVEPDYRFSKSLLPEGNPIREQYEKADYSRRATEPIERPETGAIYVDGAPSADRPISWPALVQWVDGEQTVQFTGYLLPGESLPEYPLWVAPDEPVKKPPGALIASTVVVGLASGGLYGVAMAQEARYKDTDNNPVPDGQLDDLRRTTNTLVIASAVSATAAAGMGVAVVVGW